MFKNALISVSNKKGLTEFAANLISQGTRIVSTGGTAAELRRAGIHVVEVAEQTGYPEVMDGRVRTLHPRIHMALLARDYEPEDVNLLKSEKIEPFDLVVGNLYPFGAKLHEGHSERDLVEYIDIGGPALLRAAAKNYERITVITDPSDYEWILSKGTTNHEDRKRLAAKVFAHISSYDAMVSQCLFPDQGLPQFSMAGDFVQALRYGENPHQKAWWYSRPGAPTGLHRAQVLQGKELSYNNILDLDAALGSVRDFQRPAAVVVKHNNPCGVACGETLGEAVQKALEADSVSAFGGIVALNRPVDQDVARRLTSLFLECVVGPDFTPEAMTVLGGKKNLRVLKWSDMNRVQSFFDVKSVVGGFLVQDLDPVDEWNPEWKCTEATVPEEVRRDLLFAWKIVTRLKSNAIAVAQGEQTLGLGMGQVNRVDAVEHSLARMQKHHPDRRGAVLASDAFFPFADSIEAAHRGGIQWIIQPGGSMRDAEVLAKASELKIGMVLTGKRHFRH